MGRALTADALRPPFAAASFDAVLLDAPCSGLGTLARNPDVRWRLDPRDLARHAERQRALLEAVADLVRPGGRLVYAVCSVEPEETGDALRPFLAAHPELEREELPAWAEAFADDGVVRTNPDRDRTDAFFAAALRSLHPRGLTGRMWYASGSRRRASHALSFPKILRFLGQNALLGSWWRSQWPNPTSALPVLKLSCTTKPLSKLKIEKEYVKGHPLEMPLSSWIMHSPSGNQSFPKPWSCQ